MSAMVKTPYQLIMCKKIHMCIYVCNICVYIYIYELFSGQKERTPAHGIAKSFGFVEETCCNTEIEDMRPPAGVRE